MDTVTAILQQQTSFPYEVIVVDTASTDGTPAAIERLFADDATNPHRVLLVFRQISHGEFGHGRTRNLAAHLARGTYIIYLSQDATPSGNRWLETMVRHLDDPRIATCYCRQIARTGARLPERVVLATAYPASASTQTRDSIAKRSATYILFSNAASAIRRDLLDTFPFDEDLMMCEDADWATRILAAGHVIEYVVDAYVMHSHFYTLKSILQRQFDVAVSTRHLPQPVKPASYLRFIRTELSCLAREGAARELPWTIGVETMRVAGHVLGTHHDRLPLWLTVKLTAYPDWIRARSKSGSPRVACWQPSDTHPTTVSIIIPCYNYGRYLAEAIESALAQTRPADEIIVIDDGSTDNSLEVAHRYDREPALRIISQPNQGAIRTFNNGIRASSGTFFVKLDADDRLHSRYLERTLPPLSANPNAGFVYTAYYCFGIQDGRYSAEPFSLAKLALRPYIVSSALTRRRAFDTVGGYSLAMSSAYEDWDLFLSMAECGWVGIPVRETLFDYRIHPNSRNKITFGHWRRLMTQLYYRHPQTRRGPLPLYLSLAILDRIVRRAKHAATVQTCRTQREKDIAAGRR